MQMLDKQRLALLAAFFAYLFWGFSFVFTRMALTVTTPSVLLAWRFLAAFAIMNLIRFTGRFPLRLRGKNLRRLLLLGFLQPVAYFYCETYGIQFSNASFSGVIISVIPLAALALAAVTLRERPAALQVGFSLVSIAGVVLAVLQNSAAGTVLPISVLILLGAVIADAGFVTLGRGMSGEFSAFERSYMVMLSGSVVFPLAAVLENRNNLSALFTPLASPVMLFSLGYLSLCCSVGSFLLICYAMNHLTVARNAAFANMTTAVSILAGVFILDEPFGWVSGIACCMILIGIWGVQRFAQDDSPTQTPVKQTSA